MSSNYEVEVATLVADLERLSDVSDLEARIAADDVTFVVNNAGAGGLGRSRDITADQLEQIIQLNITALTRLSHAALMGFCKREAGVLVNIGSMMAHAAAAGAAAYSGSKAYVLNFTRSLQMEYAGSPIRIQLVMPGPIRSEFFSSQGVSKSVFPPKSYLTPEQLVDAALAGLDAGKSVTIPSMLDEQAWTALEGARAEFVEAMMSGKVALRYQS